VPLLRIEAPVTSTLPLVYPLILMVSLFLVFFTHAKLKTAIDRLNSPSTSVVVPTAQDLRLLSLGFDQILADFYWLKFVGYVGDTANRKLDHFEMADRYLDLITGLDPSFVQAYWFAAFTVGKEQGRPNRAAELLERGIAANTDNWYLPFIAGNNQYLYANNGVKAAQYYRMAAKYPGAPDWLERQAAILETDIPRITKHAYSWLYIFNSADDPMVKEHARDECIRLWVLVFKTAPNEVYRSKAIQVLRLCGVDVDANVHLQLENANNLLDRLRDASIGSGNVG
jgi:tetratricopeptide (TPR) repeat protein